MSKFYKKIVTDSMYKVYKKFTDISHINGVHLDFYYQPYEYIDKSNKITLASHITKLIHNIISLSKDNIYFDKALIDVIIEQVANILQNVDYWKRYGFNDDQIFDITRQYVALENFLTNYILTIPQNHRNTPLYNYCIRYNTGYKNMTAYDVQKYGITRMIQLIEQIEQQYGTSFGQSRKKYLNTLKYFSTESELLITAKKNLITIHNYLKICFSPTILLPNPSTITIRAIPHLKALWSPTTRSYGNIIYINEYYWYKIDKDELLRAVMHEYITMVERANNKTKQVSAIKEGFATYCEKLITTPHNHLFTQLDNSIKIIVDAGLFAPAHIQFTPTTAISFIKKYSTIKLPTAEVLKSLSKPAKNIADDIGYYAITDISTQLTPSKMSKLFLTYPLNMRSLIKYINTQHYNPLTE